MNSAAICSSLSAFGKTGDLGNMIARVGLHFVSEMNNKENVVLEFRLSKSSQFWFLRFLRLVFVLALVIRACAFPSPAFSKTAPTVWMPSAVERVALFDRLVRDIDRLDGDGLTIRDTRPESWWKTVARLRLAAHAATTPAEYGHVFYRLRATYPNMHAGINLADGYSAKWMPNGVTLPIIIRAELLTPTSPRPVLRVASVNENWANAQPVSDALPRVGDSVVAINTRPVDDWLRENEIFCRYPLAGQCAVEFHRNLARGFLFWNPETPLDIELRRDGKVVKTTLTAIAPVATVNTPTVPPPSTPKTAPNEYACNAARSRVPQGFVMTWAGTMVCVFENPALPATQIWRIETFMAEQSRVKDAIPGQLKSVEQEVDTFYEAFWKFKSESVEHLIIDIAGNGGGESVVPWHGLLFKKPFQTPFVQYKKIREFDQPKVRNALFWGSEISQRFVEELKREGTFAKIREGEWLPKRQMFCPSENSNCNAAQHTPRAHSFSGRVILVIDQFCNSACVTFAWNTKDKLGARIVGLPDTADTTFSRMEIHFGFAADGAIVTSLEDSANVANTIGSFRIAATRSIDANGHVISAEALIPERIVPRAWNQNGDEWAKEAITRALQP
jgi:Peptidase family S41